VKLYGFERKLTLFDENTRYGESLRFLVKVCTNWRKLTLFSVSLGFSVKTYPLGENNFVKVKINPFDEI